MDLTTANQLLTYVGLSGVVALLVAVGVSIIVNLFIYFAQRQIDFGRDKKIAEIQAKLDSTLKQLQTNLDVKSHVTRTQFDLEFAIYRDMWKKLSDVQEAFNSVEGLYAQPNPTEETYSAIMKQFETYEDTSREFVMHTLANRLFFSKAIFSECQEIMRLISEFSNLESHMEGVEDGIIVFNGMNTTDLRTV